MADKKVEIKHDDLFQYGVHLCLISGQAAANFLPLVCYRPKKAIFLVSDEMTSQAKELKDALSGAVPSMKISEVAIGDGWDGERVYGAVYEALVELEEEAPIVNVTGGTKIMAFAAITAAGDAGMPAFYLRTGDRNHQGSSSTITIFPSGDMRKGKKHALAQYKLKIADYLAAYGYRIGKTKPDKALPKSRRELTEYLVGANGFVKQAVPRLNERADFALDNAKRNKLQKLIAPLAPARDVCKSLPIENALDELCAVCRDSGLLKIENDSLVFASEDARKYVAGGWLEEYVYDTLKRMGLDPVMDLKVERKGEREIDVAFMHKEKLYVIECKSGALNRKTKESHNIVYRLETLRKLGGIESKLVLVSYQKVNVEIRSNSEDENIHIIEDGSLNNLEEHLAKLIAQP
ncbi:MAG TPA: hypothetical protein DEO49_01225 [Sutterella sp.]|nr:hypothetical protein [Sutterella sp.]